MRSSADPKENLCCEHDGWWVSCCHQDQRCKHALEPKAWQATAAMKHQPALQTAWCPSTTSHLPHSSDCADVSVSKGMLSLRQTPPYKPWHYSPAPCSIWVEADAIGTIAKVLNCGGSEGAASRSIEVHMHLITALQAGIAVGICCV